MPVNALNRVDAQAHADRHEDTLTAAYEDVLRAAGRKAAARFRRLSPLTAAGEPPPDPKQPNWAPPNIDELVDLKQIGAQTARQTRSIRLEALAAVLGAYGETIAQVSGVQVGEPAFDVTNPAALSLLDGTAGRAGDVARSVRDDLQKTIGIGYAEGWSVNRTATQIVEASDQFSKAQARMLARTDLNGIANGGSVIAAKEVGVNYKTWLTASDDLVRPTHQDADGQTVPIDEPFDVGGESADYPGDPSLSDAEACNCRCEAPWTEVTSARIKTAFRRPFDGHLLRITTADGNEIAVTGNHPILTTAGWKPAERLNLGDDLICEARQDLLTACPDIQNVPANAEEVFTALQLATTREERMPAERVNFHGDLPDSDVDIAVTDNPLSLKGDSSLGKEFAEIALALAHREVRLYSNAPARLGVLEADRIRLRNGTRAPVGILEYQPDRAALHPVLLMEREHAHPSIEVSDYGWQDGASLGLLMKPSRLPLGAPDAVRSDFEPDVQGTDSELVADLLVRLAGRIKRSPVVGIDRLRFIGHVYNFEAEGGVFFSGGIATANCTVVYSDSLGGGESASDEMAASAIIEGGAMPEAQITIPLTLSLGRAVAEASAGAPGAAELAVAVREAIALATAPTPTWRAVLCAEGEPTEDGRLLAPGSITWRALPLTLLCQVETATGHDGAEVCGRIDRIWREGSQIMAEGVFDSGEFGVEAARLVRGETLRGVSVDLAVLDYELRPAEPPEGGALEIADAPDVAEPEMFVVLDGVIGAATICAFQAIAQATIEVLTAAGPIRLARVTTPQPSEALAASAVEAEAPLCPPAAWFDDPALEQPTLVTVSDVGRVFGHVAPWRGCHTGYAGRCVSPPRSRSGYAAFHTGRIETAEGDLLPIGKLTLASGHAALDLGDAAARAHYDNSSRVVAFVRAGEDEHGIWVAGALRPGVAPAMIQDLLANPLSGDWRNGELVAAHAVPVPGFPILQASAIGEDGEEATALILTSTIGLAASGAEEADPGPRLRVLAARARGGVEALAELARE